MRTSGLITMLVTWGIVLFAVTWMFIRVLRTPQDPHEDD